MDRDYVARFEERSAYEAARTDPPAGFPKLPDLPLGRYTDEVFYELEHEYLWKRSWLYAAHDSELRGNGAYKLCDIAGAPVLLVRGDDGAVRAFYNSCRHRGAPVVRGESGTARLLSCQFHGWTYDLRGDLVRVPDERDFVGLCRDDRSLPPVRCERWGGWYFVNLDHDAMPLSEWLEPLPQILSSVAAAPLRMFHTKSASVRCNWKILAEGFLEVYHARTVHPTTVAPTLATRGTVISLYDHGHQAMVSPVVAGTRGDGREAIPYFDGAPPAMTEANLQPAHGIFPNIITPLDGRGFPFLVFWPEAIDRTRLDITWFTADWGAELDDSEMPNKELWDRRLDRFDVLMDEDYANLEPIQRSMEHAAHGGQVLNYQERRIWHVHAWIDKVIGVDRIPPHLHVPDTLAAWHDLP
jgi:phenylpropionate dioxygenase-like ring-hydroxylating dioxygenase large terminal subunit